MRRRRSASTSSGSSARNEPEPPQWPHGSPPTRPGFWSIDESGANDANGLANPIITLPSPELAKLIIEKLDHVYPNPSERMNRESGMPSA